MNIDPAFLPGLATHLAKKSGDGTACGMGYWDFSAQGRRERWTMDWTKVDCLRCRRTLLYQRMKRTEPKT